MSAKAAKRILYGVVAVALLVVAGRQLMLGSADSDAWMAGALGVVFGFMAITGAG